MKPAVEIWAINAGLKVGASRTVKVPKSQTFIAPAECTCPPPKSILIESNRTPRPSKSNPSPSEIPTSVVDSPAFKQCFFPPAVIQTFDDERFSMSPVG